MKSELEIINYIHAICIQSECMGMLPQVSCPENTWLGILSGDIFIGFSKDIVIGYYNILLQYPISTISPILYSWGCPRNIVWGILSRGSCPGIMTSRATERQIRAPGQRRHGPSHIEQSRAHNPIYYVDNVDCGPCRAPAGPCRAPAGPLKVAGPLGFCPPCPPPSRRA